MQRPSPPSAAGVSGVTQRLIVRYAKRGRMRFASHRDVARAVERGVRRAGLPIAFSEGFTPHPKISYAGAAPTGTASEAEYLELSLTQQCTAAEVRERLDAALPDGMDVIEVTEAAPSLAALPLEASDWLVVLPGVRPGEAARAVEEFLGCQSVEVERLTNKGTRRMDARAAVEAMSVARRLPAASPRPVVSSRGGDPPEPPAAADAAAAAAGRLSAASPEPAASTRGGGSPEPLGAAGAAAAALARGSAAASPGPVVSSRGGDPPEPPGAAGAAAAAGRLSPASPGAVVSAWEGGAPESPAAADGVGQHVAGDLDPADLPGDGAGNAILRMVVRHVTPAVRPDDVMTALRSVAGLAPPSPPVVTRLAQGALDEVTRLASWPVASGAGTRGAHPEGRPSGSPVAGPGPAPGRGVPSEQVKTTHHGAGTAAQASPPPAGACNQLLRGADGPERATAPGSLTGDSPDARERAERQRTRQ
jgi:radical SAM-linked protein